jgi:hypothetical protein
MYLPLVICLAVGCGGYVFFVSSTRVLRKQRWFPYYIHLLSLLLLLIPVATGSWWAMTVALPFVALMDQWLIQRVRFCSHCGSYHLDRGWSGAATYCRRCGQAFESGNFDDPAKL